MDLWCCRSKVVVWNLTNKKGFAILCGFRNLAPCVTPMSKISLGLFKKLNEVIKRRDDALFLHLDVLFMMDEVKQASSNLVQHNFKFFWVVDIVEGSEYGMYMCQVSLGI